VNVKSSDSTPDDRAQQGAESLGALLRRAREAKNLSLRDISDQTRISRRYLEAIEADDYKNLPGGIFNRSFVKAFAKAVGVDEAQALKAYERTARAQGEPDDVPTSRPSSHIYMDGGEPVRSPALTIALSVLILAVISLGAYALLHWYQRRNESRAQSPTNTSQPAGNVNNQTAAPSVQPTAAPAPAQGLNVQVRAKGEDVWMRTRVDAESSTEGILTADQTKALTARDTVSLQYSRSKAAALEVLINGRPAVVPSEVPKGKQLVEMLIPKDGYERLLQQP
jgi:cytoskeletal protein RodZ